MQLIRCHIENFGKLSDWNYEFHKGCNTICEENGWGKSTVAAFIRIMLFGFANEGKRKEAENERKRFRPWQGGVYGGSLTYEHGGRQYVIQRVFGEKEKDDICELRDANTNLKVDTDVFRLGEDIFQIDMEAFCRSVCITQLNADITNVKTTGSMNAKLGNLVEDTGDVNQFDSVNQTLTDWLNRMSPTRKTGQLRKQKDWIAEQKQELKQKQNIEAAIQELQTKREQEVQAKAALSQELSIANDKQRQLVIQEKQERYQELEKTYQKQLDEYQQQRRWFPGDLPERETLRHMLKAAGTQTELEAVRNSYQSSTEEEAELLRYTKEFSNGVPMEDEQHTIRRKIIQWQQNKENADQQQLSGIEEERLQAYQNRFQKQCPANEDIEKRIDEWNLYLQKKAAYSTKEASVQMARMVQRQEEQAQAEQKESDSPKRTGMILLIIGIVILIAGIGLFGWQRYLGIGAVILGIGLTVAAICIRKRPQPATNVQPQEKKEAVTDALELELQQDRELIMRTEQDLSAYLQLYGIVYDSYTVLNELHRLKVDVQEYHTLQERKQQYQEAVGADGQQLETEIQGFLSSYYSAEQIASQEYLALLTKLESDVRSYLRLRDNQIQYQNCTQKIQELQKTLEDYLHDLGIEPKEKLQAQLLELQEHLQSCMEKEHSLKDAEQNKKRYEQTSELTNVLQQPKTPVLETADELRAIQGQLTHRMEELQANIHTYDIQLEEYGTRLDTLGEQELMLGEQQESYDAAMRKYHCIQATQKYLTQAKEALTARYMQPLLNGFQKYYEILTGASASRYHLDANAKLTIEEQGMQRDPELLSTGYRDLLGLCMRMAFVDAMYPEHKPFILLDDPFVNYDTQNVQGGLDFLKQVSKEYQIIYFTCHESRMNEVLD